MSTSSISGMNGRSTQRLWAARVILAVAVALAVAMVAMASGSRSDAGDLPFEQALDRIQILAEHDVWTDPDPEVNLLDKYDLVRDVLLGQGGVAIRVPWVTDLTGFSMGEGAKLYVDNDKDSLALYGKAFTLAPLNGDGQSVEVLLTADWDETNVDDADPRLVLAVRAHNIQLQDFSELFGEIGAGLSLELADGWVVFTDESGPLDLSDLPSAVVTPFFQPIQNDELLANGASFNLTQGANFMADLAINQMPALDRALSLVGVDAVHLRVHGTLATDASVLFDEASLSELAVFDVTGTLDATGANPPPWLQDRAFGIHVKSSAALVPEIDITDTISTLVGGATNVFEHGFSFDPANFGVGAIPINLKFDLLNSFAEPFGIDVPTLLDDALPGNLDISLALTGTVDLSTPNVLSSLAVEMQLTDPNAVGGPATLKIGLAVDDVLDVAVATFSADLDLSLQELANALSGAFGAPPTNLGEVGAVTIDHFGAEVKAVQGATSISVTASIAAYDDVLGFTWIDLDDLTVTLELSNDGEGGAILAAPEFHGVLSADLEVADVSWTVQVEIDASAAGVDVRVSLVLGDGESFSLQGLVDLLQADVGGVDVGELLAGLQLDGLRVTLRAGTDGIGVDALAQVVVPDLFDATLYLSIFADDDGPTFFVGVRPTEQITLGTIIAMPGLDGIVLPNVALVMTNDLYDNVLASDLTPDAFEFLKGVHGCAPDSVQPLAPGLEQPANVCAFAVRLKPGINFVANIQLPEELDALANAVWIDRSQGIQFVGTITLPISGLESYNTAGGINLFMELPALNPPETVDFIEQGKLMLNFGVTVDDPTLKLRLIGQLDVRLRRSNEPATTCEFGEPLVGADVIGEGDDAVIEHDTYCYDRLRFEVSAELAMTPTSVEMTLGGGLTSLNPNGWQAPFGLEWLTINQLEGKLGVKLNATGDLQLKLGVIGDVVVAGKQFKGSLSVGLKVMPAPPPAGVSVIPEFYGVRGFVSSVGSTDLVKLYSAFTGEAEFPVAGMPLFEVRNFEFMVSLVNDPDLCLSPGIGVAGELFFVDDLSTPFTPANLPGECAPFGAAVDPDRCASETEPGGRIDGCFSSFFGLIDFSGIRINGTIGPIDLGPVHFDDAELKIILTLEEQTFVIRGGISVPTLGSGEVAILVKPTQLQLFGHVDAFDTFMAEVEAELNIGLEPPFSPTFNASFRGALQADFDDALEGLIDDALSLLGDKVDAVQAKLTALKNADPSDFTSAVTALMTEVQKATGFDFLDDIADALDDFGEAADDVKVALDNVFDVQTDFPTVKELLDGGKGYVDWGTLPQCFFDEWDDDEGVCVRGDDSTYVPDPICIPFSEGRLAYQNGHYVPRCRFYIEVDGIDGISYSGVIADITERAADGLENVLTKLDNFASGLTLDAMLDRLDGFDVSQAFDLQCANFEFASSDDDSNVAMKLKATILGKTLGWSIDLDPQNLDVGQMVDLLMQQLLSDPADIACDEHLTPPAGLSAASFLEVSMHVTDDDLVENDLAHLTGNVAGDVGDAVVSVDWGDGSPVQAITLARGRLINQFHRYRDDPPGATSRYTITLFIDGEERATTQVSVANAKPVATAVLTPSAINEGGTVSLTVGVTDLGPLDTHTATVDWGDGVIDDIDLDGPQPFTHTYLDDDPTDSTSDEPVVKVRVVDKDGGVDTELPALTVNNVVPAVQVTAQALVNEAQSFSIAVTWTDPGINDEHTVVVQWGDGTTSSVTPAVGTRSRTLFHTYADDNPTVTTHDPYTIHVSVTDDDTGEGTATKAIEVYNVAPVVTTATLSAATINENQSVTVSGTFTDPGLLDTHTITISWGDLRLPNTVITPAAGVRSYTATKTYGDNSGAAAFTITVTVVDDDSGSGSKTAGVTVANVFPTSSITTAGSRVIGGLDTYIIGTGDAFSLGTTATDPGSDDLIVKWDYDTLTAAVDVTTRSNVPGQAGNDQLPSPNVAPRTGSTAFVDSRTTSYAAACRYDLGLGVTDDDMTSGQVVSDSAVVIVVGDETIIRTAGYWSQQYGNKPQLANNLRFCYLRIVDHLSAVFGEKNPLLAANQNGSFNNAGKILDGNQARTSLQRLDRQLLAAWLAVANGSIGYDQMVDTNGNGIVDTAMGQWLNQLETARNGTPSENNLKLWAGQLENVLK